MFRMIIFLVIVTFISVMKSEVCYESYYFSSLLVTIFLTYLFFFILLLSTFLQVHIFWCVFLENLYLNFMFYFNWRLCFDCQAKSIYTLKFVYSVLTLVFLFIMVFCYFLFILSLLSTWWIWVFKFIFSPLVWRLDILFFMFPVITLKFLAFILELKYK